MSDSPGSGRKTSLSPAAVKVAREATARWGLFFAAFSDWLGIAALYLLIYYERIPADAWIAIAVIAAPAAIARLRGMVGGTTAGWLLALGTGAGAAITKGGKVAALAKAALAALKLKGLG